MNKAKQLYRKTQDAGWYVLAPAMMIAGVIMVPVKYLTSIESELLRLLLSNSSIIFFIGSLVFSMYFEHRNPKIDTSTLISDSYIVFGLHILVKAIYTVRYRASKIKTIEVTGSVAVITATVLSLLALLSIFYGLRLRISKTGDKDMNEEIRKSPILPLHTIASLVVSIDLIITVGRI